MTPDPIDSPLPNPVRPADPWVWAPLAAALALLAAIYLTGSNTSLFLWLNGLPRLTGNALWTHLTILGDGLVALVLLLPWVRRRPDVVWAGCLAGIATTLWVHGLKPVFALPRPAEVLAPELFQLLGPRDPSWAFPSGHSTTIFALAGVIALSIASRGLRLALVLCAAAVALSRVMVGAHWPADILAGAFGGWLCAVLGLRWAGRWTWGLGTFAQRLMATLLMIAAGVLLLSHETGYPETLPLQQAIAVLALAAGAGGGLPPFLRRADRHSFRGDPEQRDRTE